MNSSSSIIDFEKYVPASDVVSCDLEGEAALLDMRSGVYFSLNRIGAIIWEHLQLGASLSALLEAITNRFDVDPEVFLADLNALLHTLQARGLIESRELAK
jgi:hypothetical protein